MRELSGTYRANNGERFIVVGQRGVVHAQQNDGRIHANAADSDDVTQFRTGQFDASAKRAQKGWRLHIAHAVTTQYSAVDRVRLT